MARGVSRSQLQVKALLLSSALVTSCWPGPLPDSPPLPSRRRGPDELSARETASQGCEAGNDWHPCDVASVLLAQVKLGIPET